MRGQRKSRRGADRSYYIVAVIVFLAGLAFSYWAWGASTQSSGRSLEETSKQTAERVERSLYERLVSYKGILNGSIGLFDANFGDVSQEQWRLFVNAHLMDEQLPAIESLGYMEKADNHDIVVYVEPQTSITPVGYDMSADPFRLETIKRADTNKGAALSHVLPPQGTTSRSLLMVYPLYRGQLRSDKASESTGYVFVNISTDKLFTYIQERSAALKSVEFGISEGDDPTGKNIVYQTKGFKTSGKEIDHRLILVGRTNWTVHSVIDTHSTEYQRAKYQPAFTFAFFFIITVLFTLVLALALRSRSRRLNLTKQLELQHSRDELLSLASHQLRTPATSVKQYLGMVLQGYAGDVDKKQAKLLARAYSSNERQLEIVNQILHISRIESGRLELSTEPVDLGEIAKSVLNDYRPILRAKRQSIKKLIDKKLPPVNGDPTYLRMVIENLISNASKYTENRGNVSVRAYAEKTDVVLEVSDTGVGIAKEDLPHLFQKFSRIHNELSVSAGGTGIGLYLSKLVVKLHGGTIEAITHKKVGTTFRVKLPIDTDVSMKNLTDLSSQSG
jgi:signal transduction histidine kinase